MLRLGLLGVGGSGLRVGRGLGMRMLNLRLVEFDICTTSSSSGTSSTISSTRSTWSETHGVFAVFLINSSTKC